MDGKEEGSQKVKRPGLDSRPTPTTLCLRVHELWCSEFEINSWPYKHWSTFDACFNRTGNGIPDLFLWSDEFGFKLTLVMIVDSIKVWIESSTPLINDCGTSSQHTGWSLNIWTILCSLSLLDKEVGYPTIIIGLIWAGWCLTKVDRCQGQKMGDCGMEVLS